MPAPTIAVVRETNAVTDAMVAAYVAAQQIQITRDFAPIWGTPADVIFVPSGQVPAGAWEVILLDNTDQAGALGYHDDTGPGGVPRAKVFVLDDLRYGLKWSVTASDEILEALVDPWINRAVQVASGDMVFEYAVESADPCEDDRFAHEINGIAVSAVATPTWFGMDRGTVLTFPSIPEIAAPFELATGGYIPYREISPVTSAWGQKFAHGIAGPRAANKRPSSRTMRRFGA
jgi:hypothetical protein